MTVRDLVPKAFRKKEVPVTRVHDPFSLLHTEMDSLFDRFYRAFDIAPWEEMDNGFFSPKVDVTESEKEVRIVAELPGVDENDVEVLLNNDSLTIRGEKKEEHETKGRNFYQAERSYGTFSRTIALPKDIESEKTEAHFKKGVLTITLPKSREAREHSRKISVKGE